MYSRNCQKLELTDMNKTSATNRHHLKIPESIPQNLQSIRTQRNLSTLVMYILTTPLHIPKSRLQIEIDVKCTLSVLNNIET